MLYEVEARIKVSELISIPGYYNSETFYVGIRSASEFFVEFSALVSIARLYPDLYTTKLYADVTSGGESFYEEVYTIDTWYVVKFFVDDTVRIGGIYINGVLQLQENIAEGISLDHFWVEMGVWGKDGKIVGFVDYVKYWNNGNLGFDNEFNGGDLASWTLETYEGKKVFDAETGGNWVGTYDDALPPPSHLIDYLRRYRFLGPPQSAQWFHLRAGSPNGAIIHRVYTVKA